MANYQITLNEQTLHRLFTTDHQLAQLLESIRNQVLEAQVGELVQAQRYERTEERQGYRTGYRPRQLTTRVGTLTLRVPQVRASGFSPELFARYQRSEQALILTLMEMVVNGVSTRKVAHITEELCGREFAKSTVSDLCKGLDKGLDPLVAAWNERALGHTRYPFVLVDALLIKVREDGRVRSCSALLATGINADGYREILGLQLGDSESEHRWTDFFRWLTGRGLSGVDLVVSDHHGGRTTTAAQVPFQGASWQRCQMQLSANVSSAAPKAVQEELHARVRAIFEAPDLPTARTLLAQVVADYEQVAPTAIATLERGFDDATAVLALPRPYRKRLRTTNGQERLNEAVRRRERVIRIFPNRQSAIRLLGALLMEHDEQWSTGKRYFDLIAYWQWRDAQPADSATRGGRAPTG